MKISLKITTILVITTLITINLQQLIAQELTAREIVNRSLNLPEGDDQTSNLTMTLTNKSGDTRVREIKQFTKKMGDVEKSIMFFIAPADVKNTSFMNWSYTSDKPDDQWIYLPAIKKTKRISSDSKSDYFMGSDFTYDDLGDRKVEDDTHSLLRKDEIEGVSYYVIESIPKEADYMYSKTITWINTESFIGLKKEFYDEDEELLKVLSILQVEDIENLLVITHSEMKNVQKNHSTSMKLSDIKINTGIEDAKFTERIMMRGI